MNTQTKAAITDEGLLLERPHPLGGVQRLYRFKRNHGLSVVNSSALHSYPFAWEIAVLDGLDEHGNFKGLDYTTPLTDDVEVCMNDASANDFIARTKAFFNIA